VVLGSTRKTLKHETVLDLNLNLVKNYQVSKRKCSLTTFFKKCTTLIMVTRFAPNKNNQKVVEEQAV